MIKVHGCCHIIITLASKLFSLNCFFSRFSLVIAEWTNLWKSSRYSTLSIFQSTFRILSTCYLYLFNITLDKFSIPGAGHPHQRADKGDEPQLHRVQVPPDQSPPLAQGEFCPILTTFVKVFYLEGVPRSDISRSY